MTEQGTLSRGLGLEGKGGQLLPHMGEDRAAPTWEDSARVVGPWRHPAPGATSPWRSQVTGGGS